MKEPGKNWSNEYLRQKIGHRRTIVEVSEDTTFEFYGEKYEIREMNISQFLDLYDEKERKLHFYLAQRDMVDDLPELREDILEPEFAFPPLHANKVLVWMGSGGQLTPLHFDSDETIMAMVDGSKKWLLYDPTMTKYLYPIVPSSFSACSSEVDLKNPDLEKFPHFAKTVNMTVTINKGDMFYLPAYWWHQVESIGRNIAVTFLFDSSPIMGIYYARLDFKKGYTEDQIGDPQPIIM